MTKTEGPSPSDLAGLGVQFVLLIVAGMYGGQWADRRFGTAPWLLIAGVFLGGVLSFVGVYRSVASLNDPRTKP